ncbi:hypothetical protein [Enterovibrio nigricans]|uniref:Uncharacterized protein n=1 Tax=Enterovibrio nigricans DSM 22720 TaxID=1121868 RepID=A0A1T4VMP4_9GAMM|nr:hypothetical protein [Enterovibrio nigricans]SKA66233.1 hypothetical protein SAMN02745132_04084 [Enterovibrio nigricans DSM 22720]
MKTPTNTTTRAQWALTLVWWVVFVCLSQNAGLFNACQTSTFRADETTLHQTTTNGDANLPSDNCELTENLISLSKFSWDNITLSLFVLVILSVGWIAAASRFIGFTPTEPILLPYRRHLMLCVFRE